MFKAANKVSNDNDVTITVTIILWFLWKARNKCKFQHGEWDPSGLIKGNKKLVTEVLVLQNQNNNHSKSESFSNYWMKPILSGVKLMLIGPIFARSK